MIACWCTVLLCLLSVVNSQTMLNLVVIYEPGNDDLLKAAQMGLTDFNTSIAGYTLSSVSLQTDNKSLVQKVCELNLTNIDGILDLTSDGFGVVDLARHLDAPVMTMKWTADSGTPTVRPNPRDYMRSLTSLMLQDNATREGIMILYEKNFDAGVMIPYEEFSWFAPVYLKEIPASAGSYADIMSMAKDLRVSEFVIASSNAVAQSIFVAGISANLTGGIHHWFLVTKDLDMYTCATCTMGQMIVFQRQITPAGNTKLASIVAALPTAPVSSRKIDLVYAYQTAEALVKTIGALVTATTWTTSMSNFTCFINSDGISEVRYTNAMTAVKTLTYTSLLGAVNFNNTHQNQYSTFMVERLVYGSSASRTSVGQWSTVGGLSVTGVDLTYLQRRMLVVMLTHEPPFVYKYSNGSWGGYSIDILNELSTRLAFDYRLVESVDGIYGVRQPNGSWNGMIGKIIDGEADIALGAITITAERETVVDFTIPYYDYAAIQILAQNPLYAQTGDQLFFLNAFTWEVWVTLIATIAGTGLLIWAIDKASPFSFQNRLKNDEIRDGEADGKIFTIKESMWFVLGAYTQAGESFDPRSISCRVIVVGFWLFAYLMMAMYTANLAAQLTVAKLTNPPASLDEYAAQTTYKYSVIKDTAVYQHFERLKNAEAEIFQFWTQAGVGTLATVVQTANMATWSYPIEEKYTNMFNRMSLWGFLNTTTSALEHIRQKDTWAVFLETPLIKYYMSMYCDIKVVGDPFAARPYGIVLQNKSPLVKEFNLVILLLQRDRILEQLKVTWWSQNKVSCPVQDANAGLSLDTLGGAFVFFAIGIGIATIIFIIEKIVAKIWGVEWAKAGANDATVVRPMGMMSTINVTGGSHISIRRHGGSRVGVQDSERGHKLGSLEDAGHVNPGMM